MGSTLLGAWWFMVRANATQCKSGPAPVSPPPRSRHADGPLAAARRERIEFIGSAAATAARTALACSDLTPEHLRIDNLPSTPYNPS